jgi:mannose-6-phosphate isomerase-like protein (cupin superfamily)
MSEILKEDIYAHALRNKDFRREILTNEHSQVVLMSVEPGDDIGEETHEVDQILIFVAGEGQAILDGTSRRKVGPNTMVVVPAGTLHNFKNTGEEPLKLFTIYAPPEEEPGTLHKTKAEAEAAEAEKEAKSGS